MINQKSIFLQKYRYSLVLLKELVVTDFKLRYQSSTLGYIWSLLRPTFLFLILYVVFVKIIPVGNNIPHFPAYLLLGLMLWNYFVEVTTGSVQAVVGKGDLMRKISFPRYVIILSGTVSAIINLGLNLIVVAVLMVASGAEPNIYSLFAPLLLLELIVFSLSIALFLGAGYVKYRDIGYVWDVFIQAGFYATPILYSFSLVIDKSTFLAKIMILNPLAQILQDVRYGLVTKETSTITSLYGNPFVRIVPLSIVLIMIIVSVSYFKKTAPYFAEDV